MTTTTATRPTATRPAAARTRRTRTTTDTARDATGRPAAAPATTDANGSNHSHANGSHANDSHANGSEQRVRAAVSEGTDLTVAALADATGLGRSTVAKALTRLEAAGHAVRTTSGSAGRARQPDRWNTARTAPAALPRQAGSRRSRDRQPSTQDTPPAPDMPAVPAADGADAPRNPKTGTARLAPGALTQLVADHFSAHPGVPLTSGEVGRVLGRSGGAVRNAADKLTGDGVLRLLDGTPRRYTTAE